MIGVVYTLSNSLLNTPEAYKILTKKNSQVTISRFLESGVLRLINGVSNSK